MLELGTVPSARCPPAGLPTATGRETNSGPGCVYHSLLWRAGAAAEDMCKRGCMLRLDVTEEMDIGLLGWRRKEHSRPGTNEVRVEGGQAERATFLGSQKLFQTHRRVCVGGRE